MKIAKIINGCKDCEHCILSSSFDKYHHFAVCTYTPEGFLLFHGSEPASRFILEIPQNCPLEDYKGNQTIEE